MDAGDACIMSETHNLGVAHEEFSLVCHDGLWFDSKASCCFACSAGEWSLSPVQLGPEPGMRVTDTKRCGECSNW